MSRRLSNSPWTAVAKYLFDVYHRNRLGIDYLIVSIGLKF